MVIQAITHSLLQIVIGGNTSPAVPDTYQSAAPEGLNVLVMILNAGWSMLPIFALLIFTVYSFVGRYFTIAKAGRDNHLLMQNVGAAIQNGSIEDALKICRQKDTVATKMTEKGILRIGRPLADISSAIDNVGRLELATLEKLVPRLQNIAVLAILFGFLGTAMSLIHVFGDASTAAESPYGICDAIVPVIAGLIVGIIAYWCYSILNTKVKKVAILVALCSTEFMDMLVEPAK